MRGLFGAVLLLAGCEMVSEGKFVLHPLPCSGAECTGTGLDGSTATDGARADAGAPPDAPPPLAAPGSWRPMSATGEPTARAQHVAVWTGRELVVFGGMAASGADADAVAWRYSPTDDRWVPGAVAPAGMVGMTGARAIWTGREVWVLGGQAGGGRVLGGAAYVVGDDAWKALPSANAPAPEGHAAIWTGTEAIVLGGNFGAQPGARLLPGEAGWRPVPDAPGGTGLALAMWDDRVAVFGDRFARAFDPALGTWELLPTTNLPLMRAGATLVALDDGGLFVWGAGEGASTPAGARLSSGIWRPAPGPLDEVFAPQVAWTGTCLVAVGGATRGLQPSATAAQWCASGSTWWPVSMTGLDHPGRRGGTFVWTGSEALLFGGVEPSGIVSAGARWQP